MQMLIVGLGVGVLVMGVLNIFVGNRVWKKELREYDEFVKRERGK